ncbi:hypothetical protein V5N11_021687 [Cardamine amara subsp. amara]|uniref:DUF7705 domain-containing protein n=1 Tax=Cardamine amara subsp. amara TaxID=228776 RepID=A0ABD1BRT0_CARAN
MASLPLLLLSLLLLSEKSSSLPKCSAEIYHYVTALGDGGMKNPNTRIALEAWNFCNEVGNEAPSKESPRFADCAPLSCPIHQDSLEQRLDSQGSKCEVYHLVNEIENKLAAGDKFPVSGFISYKDPDLFANEKERYLGSLCKIHDDIEEEPWYFWMIMLKNGNFDKNSTLCPEYGRKVSKIVTGRNFPCFGQGCMNQPLVYHNYSRLVADDEKEIMYLSGGFNGTYDLDSDLSKGVGSRSFFSVSS